jgi:DNA polymerase I-like protein with 3'-5' exonuclease and polymerase domains
MARATLALVDQVGCEYAGPGTGLINQCHDALVLEVPEYDAPRVARILTDAMTQTFDALPGVRFTGTANIAGNWKDA